MSTRVWRELAHEASVSTSNSSLVRIVLVTMALDPTSAMSEAQRHWTLEEMGQRTRPFTAQELARLKETVMAYVETRLPGTAALVAKQFSASDF